MRNINKVLVSASIFVACLSGCGGGGGSAGTQNGAAPSGVATPAATVASFVYQIDKNSLTNSGGDVVLLTVTALDSNNNPVVGAPIKVAVSSGVYTPIVASTSGTGVASGNISIGGDKSNRDIIATVSTSGKSTAITIPVTGSKITLTPIPGTAEPGRSVQLSVKVTDTNGLGIANSKVALSGTLGFTDSVTTDATGVATVTLGAAPSVAGSYLINVSGSGVVAVKPFVVIAVGGGGVAAANGVIDGVSLSISGSPLKPNAAGTTTSRAGLKAVFLDSANKPIQNVRVRFEISSPSLDSAEAISTGGSTVYSDLNGDAISDYIAGFRSSGTDKVAVRMCYGNNDSDIANGQCPLSVTRTLTVAGQSVSISLGDNNELVKGPFNLTYIKKFNVGVVDAAGNAIVNAQISATVDLISYRKGRYSIDSYRCLNKDRNRNGTLDDNERTPFWDSLYSGVYGPESILPRKADAILSFVGTNVTGTNGQTTVQVEYPQNVANWLEYSVKVTTNVAGSEGTDVKVYVTDFVKGDEVNGSFLVSPYGVIQSCTVPN